MLGDFCGSRIIQTRSHEFRGICHQHHCRGNSQKVSMRGGEGKGRGGEGEGRGGEGRGGEGKGRGREGEGKNT